MSDINKKIDIPDHCVIASDAAANKAVKEVFAKLGVDVDKPDSVKEFVEDLRFGGRMRKYADRGMTVVVTVIAGALVLAAWEGFVMKIKQMM